MSSEEVELLDLPPEVLLVALKNLDMKDLMALSLTCSVFSLLANDETLWEGLCFKRWSKWNEQTLPSEFVKHNPERCIPKRISPFKNPSQGITATFITTTKKDSTNEVALKVSLLPEITSWREAYIIRRKIDIQTFKLIKNLFSPSLDEQVISKRKVMEMLIHDVEDFPEEEAEYGRVVMQNRENHQILSCTYEIRSELVDKLVDNQNIGMSYWAKKVAKLAHENILLENWMCLIEKEITRQLRPYTDGDLNYEDGAILIARWGCPKLAAKEVKDKLDNLAKGLEEYLCSTEGDLWRLCLDDKPLIQRINKYFFDELGYKGNSGDYYNVSNSYINCVLDNKTGIPITMSLVYTAVTGRIGIDIEMLNTPSHFLVRYVSKRTSKVYIIDVFNKGEILQLEEAHRTLPRAPYRAVWIRMLYNLIRIAYSTSIDMMIYVVRLIVALDPSDHNVNTLLSLLIHLEKNNLAKEVAIRFFAEDHQMRIAIVKQCETQEAKKQERKSRKAQVSPDGIKIGSVITMRSTPMELVEPGLVCKKWFDQCQILLPKSYFQIAGATTLKPAQVDVSGLAIGRYFIGKKDNRYIPNLRVARNFPLHIIDGDLQLAIDADEVLRKEIYNL